MRYKVIESNAVFPELEYTECFDSFEDAKDGDVLVCDIDKRPFIFKGLLDSNHPDCPVAYCGINSEGLFQISTGIHWWTDDNVKPAIKEQRELLFQEMREVGYAFDFERKELKESNPDNIIEESYQQQADDLIDMVTEKSNWNEVDVCSMIFQMLQMFQKSSVHLIVL